MPLINLRNIHLSFGGPPLLEKVDLAIEKGERICLVGRNGTGKSSLLKVIAGELQPDDGVLSAGEGLRVSRLEQEVPEGLAGTVFDVVADGLAILAELVKDYHRLSQRVADGSGESDLERLASVQQQLEATDGWQAEQRVEEVLSRLRLDGGLAFGTLSGGGKRRVLLARALVAAPDLLLLDEPTNHLDIDAIGQLEELLLGYQGALLFVTHDRAFLRRLATRILELDRGRITDWPGDYDNFLRRKEEALHAEELAHARFDRRLSEEEVWVRKGIKARRTRNEGRVRALQAMREERSVRRESTGKARMRLQEAERSGRLVVEAEHIGYAWADKPIVRDFSTLVVRGDRVGLVGPNGVGKTTLLNLLLGRLPPDSGRVRLGTRLEVAYFDQLRAQLDPERTVRDSVGGGSDQVTVNGSSRHVLSYLKDFLFTPDRARQPVKALSGGERNRLLLARLFLRPSNLLVMDEPTNDLDMETLELLEELILDYKGTLLLVTHDRAFLDNVVTSCLVLEGDGRVGEYVGGYRDWLRQRRPAAERVPGGPSKQRASVVKRTSPGKLSYKDRRELEVLPAHIEALEAEQSLLQERLADPAFYNGDGDAIAEVKRSLDALGQSLAEAYRRWEHLEEAQGS